MASTTAASGEPKVAAIPAAAPLASRILRWLGETRTTWPMSEPMAPPGDDDRALRAEGATGADGHRRRERLGDRGARGDPALAEQDRLHGLGQTVARGSQATTGEEGHDRRTGHGRDHHERADLAARRGSAAPTPTGGRGPGW